jgi:hypothetical protein
MTLARLTTWPASLLLTAAGLALTAIARHLWKEKP